MKKSEFEEAISKYVKSLKFKPELLDALELTFMKKYRQREKEIVKASSDIHQTIANLEIEQASKLEIIATAKSAVVRERFEKDVDLLEEKIKEAKKERLKIQITRDDIKSFVREVKNIMEHPAEILLQPSNPMGKEKLFELFFEKMPTYADIVSGTPKLSYVFNLSTEFIPDMGKLVTLPGVGHRFSPAGSTRDPASLAYARSGFRLLKTQSHCVFKSQIFASPKFVTLPGVEPGLQP